MTDIATALRDKAEALKSELFAKVEANLSGDVLHERSGALKASIVADITGGGESLTSTIASTGVPYAAIQEFGGTTPPHDIVPVKAKALAFAGIVVTRVHHPGSVIPSRPFLGSALDAMHDEIVTDLKSSILTALCAT